VAQQQPKREKVEPGIWRRHTANGSILEVTYRDAEGKQRREKVDGGILAARKQLRKAQASATVANVSPPTHG
jgi:hypothetical protein